MTQTLGSALLCPCIRQPLSLCYHMRLLRQQHLSRLHLRYENLEYISKCRWSRFHLRYENLDYINTSQTVDMRNSSDV
jgi:hypothetical protein